ncbi:Alpha/beta hydrolase fold containing protein [Microbacterium sp. C448]|uniref:alpha/beta fold hydrolase n=1 Tax=Microbacterium sp. C448 TaxID=1177594 RepID=UPI0003DE50A2|nr:alpha/beta hydrolase [Microbacterium sp. C448]CDK00018.1 Alpha/beta hydrolase fold containing protein [Microbacterium sp. C448]
MPKSHPAPSSDAEPRDRTVRIGDQDVVYEDTGVRGGPTLVLVHGIGMGHSVFRALAGELGTAGRVLALDLPGFGESPEPSSPRSMAESGDLIVDFVKQLGIDDPVLVGHSMGTQVVVEAVARHPEVSDRIVLIAPTVNAAERSVRKQAWRMVQDLVDENPRVIWIGAVHYVKTGPRWFLRKLRVMLDHHIEETLPEVQAEALVLRGADDRVCPLEWVAHVTELLPHAGMREIPERGHEAMITNPDPAARLIIGHARGE